MPGYPQDGSQGEGVPVAMADEQTAVTWVMEAIIKAGRHRESRERRKLRVKAKTKSYEYSEN